MFDFFDAIAGWLEAIGQLLVTLFENWLILLITLRSLIDVPLFLIQFMPPFLGTAIMATIVIFVVKFILGR